jgi:hypothetical protein
VLARSAATAVACRDAALPLAASRIRGVWGSTFPMELEHGEMKLGNRSLTTLAFVRDISERKAYSEVLSTKRCTTVSRVWPPGDRHGRRSRGATRLL